MNELMNIETFHTFTHKLIEIVDLEFIGLHLNYLCTVLQMYL